MSELQINTTQNVKISFSNAAIGQRIGAFLIDGAIKMGYVMLTMFSFDAFKGMDTWSQAAINSLLGLPLMFYSLFQEYMLNGQTLGKRVAKVRVVKIDGYQASFADYLVRWFFRIVDVYILCLGFFVIIFSKKKQRLGDLAAGTAVIQLNDKVSIRHTILENLQTDYKPTYSSVIKLSDNDARIIKDTFVRAKEQDDYKTIKKLKQKLIEVLDIKDVKQQTDKAFVEVIMKDYNYYTQDML